MYDEGADEFLATFLGVAMRPRSTLARLEKEKGAVLPLALTEQYKYQVRYQGPLFLVATCVVAGLLLLISRVRGSGEKFGIVFARISFANQCIL